MRSKLICSLVSVIALTSASASADTTRLRIAIDDLPKQDEPIKVSAKNAMLPNDAHEGGTLPKAWRVQGASDAQAENGRCTDDRRGAVATMYGDSTWTKRIWEAEGKTWLDNVDVESYAGKIKVKSAERVPLARITDGIWGYRRKDDVVLVTAVDVGFMDHGPFYECRIDERTIDVKGGTTVLDSSPKDAEEVRKEVLKWSTPDGVKPKPQPEWQGVEFRALATVSKSSVDASTMLSLVLRRP